MYTDIKSVQIIISLLKKYDIKHIVISPGTRHRPFVHSVETDPFFTCYSIVDERSAAFFALGLIQELNEPVVISCTSGTPISNYVSAVSEAFYQKFPLIVLTADRNPYYLNQQEDQMVPQVNMLKEICKKTVTLPLVKDQKDFWYCSRIVNEALLEMDHHGKGPIHINYPVEDSLFAFNTPQLPDVIRTNRISIEDSDEIWNTKGDQLKNASRILISYGQSAPINDELEEMIEDFVCTYNCAIIVDHLANLKCFGTVEIFTVSRTADKAFYDEMSPDILITMGGNAVEIRERFGIYSGKYRHWHVGEEGTVSDPFKSLTDIFECPVAYFFEKLSCKSDDKVENTYLDKWQAKVQSIKIPEFGYSDIYAVQQFMKKIPGNSLFHIGNSNSARLPQHFPLEKSIRVCCNRGTNGIDGSMSTFIGQATINKNLCFLLIGDLSFFYDMNGLWNKYIGSNIRILLNNNGSGEIFYGHPNMCNIPTLGLHTAAEHDTSAKAWVESRGFQYLCATNKEEFDEMLPFFINDDSPKPIFFEVVTDKFANVQEINNLYNLNRTLSTKTAVKNVVKKIIGR